MVFGGRSNKPASKAAVLAAGAFMSAVGALFLAAFLVGEPAPDVPVLALIAGLLLAVSGFAAGVLMLITGLRMK
jgi:hypothetical protein